MEIRRMYEYRTDFAREVFSCSVTRELSPDTPRAASTAEQLLLGVRVQLTVLKEAYRSELLEPEDYRFKLKKVLHPTLRQAKTEMDKVRGNEELTYDGMVEFLEEVKALNEDIKEQFTEVKKALNEEED